jgi:hypothetical protein
MLIGALIGALTRATRLSGKKTFALYFSAFASRKQGC